MRYWAYMNNEFLGPFEKEKLAELPNFSSSSLICPETPVGEQAGGWKEASTYPEVSAILTPPASAPVKPRYPAAEPPLALTMRGSLILEPAAEPPAVFSLEPITAVNPGVLEPPEETPKPGVPAEQLGAMLISIGDNQVRLLDRLSRLETAIMEVKTLLSPEPPKK